MATIEKSRGLERDISVNGEFFGSKDLLLHSIGRINLWLVRLNVSLALRLGDITPQEADHLHNRIKVIKNL